jgi:hypothetical protein
LTSRLAFARSGGKESATIEGMTIRLILSILVGFFLLGGGGYAGFTYFNKPKPQTYIVCPVDTKQCKDGITVGRISPSCEFALCPEERPEGGGGITVLKGASLIGAFTGTLEEIRENGGDYQCSIKKNGEATSTDTIYASQGELRADFEPGNAKSVETHLILAKGMTYAWSRSSGVSFVRGSTGGDEHIKKILSTDYTLPMTFDCVAWVREAGQFTPPTDISFRDVTPVSSTSTPS